MPIVAVATPGPGTGTADLCVPLSDLEAFLQRDLTGAEETAALLILELACGLVRGYAPLLDGISPFPAEARAVVLSVASRNIANPAAAAAVAAGVTAESIEGYSVTYASSSSSSSSSSGVGGGLALTEMERRTLRRWRDNAGTVQVESAFPPVTGTAVDAESVGA